MSQALGAIGLLDFTMFRPDLAWRTFLNFIVIIIILYLSWSWATC
jgi:hypothetical protein